MTSIENFGENSSLFSFYMLHWFRERTVGHMEPTGSDLCLLTNVSKDILGWVLFTDIRGGYF